MERKQKKKGKKIPDQGSKENRRNMQKGLLDQSTSEQIQSYYQVNKKENKRGNHDLKWSSSFDCQPKSCASVTCSPHTKQKLKRKRPKTLKAKVHTKKEEISQDERKEGKFPNQRVGRRKERKENSRSMIERKQKKYA